MTYMKTATMQRSLPSKHPIQQCLPNPASHSTTTPRHSQKQLTTTRTQNPTANWATFTYIGKETNLITNVFKKTNVKIAFWTSNAIQRLLMYKQQKTDIQSQSGVYKLTCRDCWKAYVEQTVRSFTTCFREHKNVFRTTSHPSNFPKYLTELAHSLGPINNTMQKNTTAKQRSTFKHYRTLLLLRRIHKQQPPKWWLDYLPEEDLWYAFGTPPNIIRPHNMPLAATLAHSPQHRCYLWF